MDYRAFGIREHCIPGHGLWIKQMNSDPLLTKYFIPKDSLVSRQIAGEIIIVPIKKRADDVDNIYSINDTGARIWELMDGTRSLDQIIRIIIEEYEVDGSKAVQDAVDFVTKLLTIEALDEVHSDQHDITG